MKILLPDNTALQNPQENLSFFLTRLSITTNLIEEFKRLIILRGI